jgi:hypothetical protein
MAQRGSPVDSGSNKASGVRRLTSSSSFSFSLQLKRDPVRFVLGFFLTMNEFILFATISVPSILFFFLETAPNDASSFVRTVNVGA